METIATVELIPLKAKYMRLSSDEKDELSEILNCDDLFDIIESEETAKNYLGTLTDTKKKDLVDAIFSYFG